MTLARQSLLGALKAQTTENKIGKLDLIKIKNFCASKDTIKKVKRQPTKSEKNICDFYQIRDLYLRSVKNSGNSVMKRQSN